LAVAFRHMVGDVQSQERALARLNEALEQRVEERTEELRRQQGLRHLILENVADGVVVADVSGRFLLGTAVPSASRAGV
jgi:PAS domain-containing protein